MQREQKWDLTYQRKKVSGHTNGNSGYLIHIERGEAVMSDRTKGIICQMVNSVIFAGMIILFIGLYYLVIKAGIPYQDPPLELQIKYVVNDSIGQILTGNGFLIAVCGGVVRLTLWLIWRNSDKPK